MFQTQFDRSCCHFQHACAVCNARYLSKTAQHFSTRLRVIRAPLIFSNICRIRNIVACYVQQIASLFSITPLVVSE